MMKSVLVAVERLKSIPKYKTKLRRTKKFMVSYSLILLSYTYQLEGSNDENAVCVMSLKACVLVLCLTKAQRLHTVLSV